ncbi:hypothetical protein HT747_08640 [Brevibacillus borstelensis]|uniref:hypothetical protein n=1 Tax=Brevibacillus borstelensis TaxID=45462 RepID=UPI0015625019|nr:hypothetical protein [Brevibacillus borstelensis]MBE5395204.1 hypothetical protein [Brevibacillus borstelensis]
MPMLLRRDAVRLFEASVESLNLALVGLGLPRRTSVREDSAKHAAEIGLIGASAEQAMSACLVQAFGGKILEKESGKFKTGGQILGDFRKMLLNPVPRTSFITKGVNNSTNHLKALHESTQKFSTLITARAGGLHAGKGPSRDICVVLAWDVVSFLNLLAQSTRIRPYLENLPEPPEVVKDREIILEDLARRIQVVNDPKERAGLLSAVYLVLPEIPLEKPEWADAFDRVTVAPREQDVSYLLNILENSKVASLFRVAKSEGGEGKAIPVTIKSDDPDALPISPQYLKREFTTIREQFFAEAALANGRLSKRSLHNVSQDLVLDVFVLGWGNTGILDGETISAQQIWPFILSGFTGTRTTPGPYWFLVRKVDDLKQLNKYLERASALGNKSLKNKIAEVLDGLKFLSDPQGHGGNTSIFQKLNEEIDEVEAKKTLLSHLIIKNKGDEKELPENAAALVNSVAEGDLSVGDVLLGFVENKLGITELKTKRYWVTKLAEVATEEDDLPGLLAVLRSDELSTVHTVVRKAFRRIDFLSYGPSGYQDV